MGNPFLDAIGNVGYALDTPGAYFRGALAGSPGERYSGRDLLSTYGLTDESDPWGGVKGFGAEMVLDPLAIAGPALGAFKGIKGINSLTSAAARYGDDVGRLAARVPAPGEAFRIQSGIRDNHAFSELLGAGDEVLGHTLMASHPGHGETSLVARHPVFSQVVPPGSQVGRMNEIGLFDRPGPLEFSGLEYGGLRGRGFGQQMMVDGLAASPVEWYFNSQASDMAAAMFNRLRDKGMIDLTWDARHGVPNVGGPFVTRLTPAGRQMAGTMGLVKPASAQADPRSPIAQVIARFMGDEEGAMRPFMEVGRRTDPDYINSVPWYHGSGTPGLTPEMLDPMKTDPTGLFDRGIYMSASPEVVAGGPESYAFARAKEGMQGWSNNAIDAAAGAGLQRGERGADLAFQSLLDNPAFMAGDRQKEYIRQVIASRPPRPGGVSRSVMTNLQTATPDDLSRLADVLRGLGVGPLPPVPRPTLYEANTNFGKIFDMDLPLSADPRVLAQMVDMNRAHRATEIANLEREVALTGGGPDSLGLGGAQWMLDTLRASDVHPQLPGLLKSPGDHLFSDLFQVIREDADRAGDIATSSPMISGMRGLGIDAFSHTGGLRSAAGRRNLHQVLIGLDPNDTVSHVGRAGQITRFEPQDIDALLRQFRGG